MGSAISYINPKQPIDEIKQVMIERLLYAMYPDEISKNPLHAEPDQLPQIDNFGSTERKRHFDNFIVLKINYDYEEFNQLLIDHIKGAIPKSIREQAFQGFDEQDVEDESEEYHSSDYFEEASNKKKNKKDKNKNKK